MNRGTALVTGVVLMALGVTGLVFGTAAAQPVGIPPVSAPRAGVGPGGWGPGGWFGPGMMGYGLGGPSGYVSMHTARIWGNQTPSGATVVPSAHRIVFHGQEVRLTVVAAPPGQRDETFRVAGMVNPTVVLPRGARVTVTLVNADEGMEHDFAVTDAAPPFPYMSMMAAPPAFPGAVSALLPPAAQGRAPQTELQFTASQPGTYRYLCLVPGHAAKGMYGTLVVG